MNISIITQLNILSTYSTLDFPWPWNYFSTISYFFMCFPLNYFAIFIFFQLCNKENMTIMKRGPRKLVCCFVSIHFLIKDNCLHWKQNKALTFYCQERLPFISLSCISGFKCALTQNRLTSFWSYFYSIPLNVPLIR